MNTFSETAERAYQTLLELETSAGPEQEDQRFFAAYLLGHASLIAASEAQAEAPFSDAMETSIEQAFAVDQLSDQDKAGIKSLWQAISADIGRGL
ncbi:MAG: hypothetical protein CMI01_00550 [Oceanospirillaceae bacterium]|nr:hypothetical protein [Oceanospirillaceae bacterium]